MTYLAHDTNLPDDGNPWQEDSPFTDCAARLLEVVPPIMRHIRNQLRTYTMKGLTLPQFRALNYLRRHPDSSLSHVAEHLGLTPPTVSKMIQKLVDKGIIVRNQAADRRMVRLSLSEEGISALRRAWEETRKQLAENIQTLNPEELNTLSEALEYLERIFSRNGDSVNNIRIH